MRLYAILEDVGSEYETLAPITISLTPFDNECYFIDLEGSNRYNTIIDEDSEDCGNWNPYNAEVALGNYACNPNTGEYINSEIISWSCYEVELENGEIIKFNDPKYKDWDYEYVLFQQYKNGLPVGEPYFKFNE